MHYLSNFFFPNLQCHSHIKKKKKKKNSLLGLFVHSSIQRIHLIEANKTPKLRNLVSPIHSFFDEWSYPFIAKTQENIWHCPLACWTNKCITYPTFFFLSKLQCHSCIQKKKVTTWLVCTLIHSKTTPYRGKLNTKTLYPPKSYPFYFWWMVLSVHCQNTSKHMTLYFSLLNKRVENFL